MIRKPDATVQPAPQDIQLMSKHRVLSFKPQLRLEWRGQDGQNETEQPDHSASLGDSITSSTRTFCRSKSIDFTGTSSKTPVPGQQPGLRECPPQAQVRREDAACRNAPQSTRPGPCTPVQFWSWPPTNQGLSGEGGRAVKSESVFRQCSRVSEGCVMYVRLGWLALCPLDALRTPLRDQFAFKFVNAGEKGTKFGRRPSALDVGQRHRIAERYDDRDHQSAELAPWCHTSFPRARASRCSRRRYRQVPAPCVGQQY